jgi:prevent-host-death family protein
VSVDRTYTVAVPVINIRQLARSTGQVIRTVVKTKRPAIVTKHGRPVAVVTALDPDALEDWILANAPGSVRAMREGERDLAAGRVAPLEQALADLRGVRKRAGRRAKRATRRS